MHSEPEATSAVEAPVTKESWLPEARVRALFVLAGLPAIRLWKLPNGYWPEHRDYHELRELSPWWLVKTAHGLIEIGWRKRVLQIDWSDTGLERKITTDNVTSLPTLVHAWTEDKALEYLRALAQALDEAQSVPTPQA